MIDTKADRNIYMYTGDYVLLILITSYMYMYTCGSFLQITITTNKCAWQLRKYFTKNKFQNM